MPGKFYYGGQAVIEGVMIRGQRHYAIAFRSPTGEIVATSSTLNTLFTGSFRRIPLLRGIVVLAETLVLGMRALSQSANVAMGQEQKELSSWALLGMLTISLTLAVAIFFVIPLAASSVFDRLTESSLVSNIAEGIIRLIILVAYIWGISFMRDIRRVYAYHGAEHMTVHAYEAGDPLDISSVRQYSRAHPRCGTAFLLTVIVLATVIFAMVGRPSLPWMLVSRIGLLPIIASISYEVIRFTGAHFHNPLVRILTSPSLALQALTTRKPDDDQIEVAIHAMNTALAADAGIDVPMNVKTGPGETGQGP